MKKYILLFGIIILYNYSLAQFPFKKVITYNNNNNNYDLLPAIKDSSGNYLIAQGNSMIKIDSSANLLSFHSWFSADYLTFGTYYLSGFIIMPNGRYVFYGAEKDTFSQFGGDGLFMTDTSGTILWKQVYDTVPTTLYGGNLLILLNDGNLLTTGTEDGNDVFPGYIILRKTDSTGNQMWKKLYNAGINNNQRASSVLMQTLDGNYLIGLSSVGNSVGGSGLLKVDTSGNPLWAKSYFRPTWSHLKNILENPDRTLMMLFGFSDTMNINYQFLYLLKVDSAGGFLWAKSYNGYFDVPSSLRASNDGGFIISATVKPQNRAGKDIMLIKTDSVGNVEWRRSHGGVGTDEVAIDAVPTNDGGYFVIGNTNAQIPGAGYYIFKTDSLGFADSCQQYTDTLIVTDVYTTDSSLTIPVSNLPLMTFNSLMHDSTLLYSPQIFDGCNLNVGVPKLTNYNSKMIVYPNPSNGKVTIKKNEVVSGENTITVYDDMGKVILQKPYNDEKDSQIDLSKYGKGVYLIKVLWNGGMRINKVVVE